jgi:hypothetical protein
VLAFIISHHEFSKALNERLCEFGVTSSNEPSNSHNTRNRPVTTCDMICNINNAFSSFFTFLMQDRSGFHFGGHLIPTGRFRWSFRGRFRGLFRGRLIPAKLCCAIQCVDVFNHAFKHSAVFHEELNSLVFYVL